MSSSITSANWASVGASGSWTDPTKWNPASVPGATNNVLIGTATVNTTAPWTVSVAGTQAANNLTLEMGSGGTLALAGTLNVAGQASLGYGTVAGAAVNLGAGAALSVAGNMVAYDSTFEVNGATITTGGYADLDGDSVAIQNGVWNANTLWLGQFFSTKATVGAGGRIAASGEINIGGDASPSNPFALGAGTLIASSGGQVSAPTLHVMDGSVVTVDATSGIEIGGAPSVAGAVAVGAVGTLALEAAKIEAAVVDNGALTALVNLGASSLAVGTGPIITGALSGTGSVHVGHGYTMEVGSANGFSGAVTIDAGGALRIDAGTPPTGPITMGGGTLDLRGLSFGAGPAVAYAGGTLTVGADTLDVTGTGLSAASFHVSADAGGGTQIVDVACYAAGTRIATEHGEVAVETLQPGDRVRTHGGRIAPVRWVGQTTVDVRAAPHAVPVCIAAGAFAPGLPRRDLLVSGDHAIALDGVLIPARKLANGATIRPFTSVAAITYVHVELDRHDLLLAEGLPAESYLDTGNRGQLQGTAAPRFDADPETAALRIFAERGCAPLVLRGPLLDAARDRLRARAEALGWRLVTDPGLTVEADRPGVQVTADGPDALLVQLPAGVREVRLLSRRFVPAMLDSAIADGRQLGAALDVELDGVWLDGAAFGNGWYPSDAVARWRWTDGAATLLLPGRARPSVLTVHLMRCGARYWVAQEAMAQAA